MSVCKSLLWREELLSPGPGVNTAVFLFIGCGCEVFGKLSDSGGSYPMSGLIGNVLQSVICLWCTCMGNCVIPCLHLTHRPRVTKTTSRIWRGVAVKLLVVLTLALVFVVVRPAVLPGYTVWHR